MNTKCVPHTGDIATFKYSTQISYTWTTRTALTRLFQRIAEIGKSLFVGHLAAESMFVVVLVDVPKNRVEAESGKESAE